MQVYPLGHAPVVGTSSIVSICPCEFVGEGLGAFVGYFVGGSVGNGVGLDVVGGGVGRRVVGA